MQYWLGANERTRVLPTDKWYLDFATSILPLVKASPLFNKEELRTQIDAAISLGMYFQDAIAQSGGWKLFSEAFQGVYGTYLPFYPLSDDYTPDEINQEDIAFVLWTLKSQFSIFDKEKALFSWGKYPYSHNCQKSDNVQSYFPYIKQYPRSCDVQSSPADSLVQQYLLKAAGLWSYLTQLQSAPNYLRQWLSAPVQTSTENLVTS